MKSPVEAVHDTSHSQRSQGRKWYTVFALSAAYLIDSMETFTTQFLWPYIYPVLGIPVANLAIIQSLQKVLAAVTGPVWGYLADRHSRKWLLVIMTGVWGLWTSAKGIANTFSQLLLFSILAGVGLNVLESAALSILSDLFERKTRGRAMGIMIAAGFAGSAISIVVLGGIAETRPEAWRVGFIIMGVLSFISGLLLLAIVEPARGSAEPEISDVVTEETAPRIELTLVPQLLKTRSWVLILISENLHMLGFAIINSWAFTWMIELNYGPRVQIALLLMLVGTILGHLLIGWISDWFEKRYPSHARTVIGLLGLVINAASAYGMLQLGDQGIQYLFIFGLLFGLTFAMQVSGARLPMQQSVLIPELRSTGRSVIIWSTLLLTAGGLAISGWLLNRLGEDLQAMMLAMVPGPILLAALCWTALFWTYPSDIDALHQKLTGYREDITGVKQL